MAHVPILIRALCPVGALDVQWHSQVLGAGGSAKCWRSFEFDTTVTELGLTLPSCRRCQGAEKN